MYVIFVLNHDGWERFHLAFDAFDEAFMKALEMVAKATDTKWTQRARIKYKNEMLLDIHPSGAKKLWEQINGRR